MKEASGMTVKDKLFELKELDDLYFLVDDKGVRRTKMMTLEEFNRSVRLSKSALEISERAGQEADLYVESMARQEFQ